jgi:hypothetical protein
MSNSKKVPVSIGEYIDKITILAIKSRRITDKDKVRNVLRELNQLILLDSEKIIDTDLYRRLIRVNEDLWEVEDAIRVKEKNEQFDDEFIELARSVYRLNDRRADLKRQINLQYESDLIEEKSYNG